MTYTCSPRTAGSYRSSWTTIPSRQSLRVEPVIAVRAPNLDDLSGFALGTLPDPGGDRLDRLIRCRPRGDFDAVTVPDELEAAALSIE